MDRAALFRLLHAALAWWWAGIQLCVPPSARRRWFPPQDVLEVRPNAGMLAFVHRSAITGEVCGSQQCALDGALGSAELPTWLARDVPSTASVRVLVPEQRVLSRTLQLPLAVEPDLQGMLALDLPRLTPFSREEVFLDAAVLNRDVDAKTLICRFAAIRRKDVEPILDCLDALGRPGHAITVDPPFEVPLDLLPATRRPQGDIRARQRTVLATGLAVTSLLMALYGPLSHQGVLLTHWQQEVAVQKDRAAAAQSLLAQREAFLQRSQFIAARRTQRPPVMAALTELTTRLPDTAWVHRLMVQGMDIQIFGEADSATALIPLLEASERFEQVDFRSPTTRNETTAKDRFHIGLTLTSNVANP